jgi:NADPH:quinone reductase-like Zn-dependent oxidoreductase
MLGDEVYGATNEQLTGAYAEYAQPLGRMMSQKPKTLNFIEAASAPIVTVTAWQMLFDYGHVTAGQTVLVHGAAGNVGAYAVQLASQAGLHVVATAAATDLDYVRGLGAERVVDHRKERFEESLNGVDVVLDTVGGETQERSLRVLKPGGILVSVVSPVPDAAQKALWRASSVLLCGCDYSATEHNHTTIRQRKTGYESRDRTPAGTSPQSARDAPG